MSDVSSVPNAAADFVAAVATIRDLTGSCSVVGWAYPQRQLTVEVGGRELVVGPYDPDSYDSVMDSAGNNLGRTIEDFTSSLGIDPKNGPMVHRCLERLESLFEERLLAHAVDRGAAAATLDELQQLTHP